MAVIESRYKAMNNRIKSVKHIGYDYKGRIMLRNTDPNLYKNDKLRIFVSHIDDLICSWISAIKKNRIINNYAADSDCEDIS